MKTQLNRVPLKDTIKVIMPDDILNKIKYLCKEIPRVEWSGILLYSTKGSIKKPASMEVILEDIIPMDKGDSTYTEYKFNEQTESIIDDKMIDYFNRNPIALEKSWKIGQIHSHNIMDVFFSETDMEELNDNIDSHDFYLSLIVNNYMDFCAKIAIKSKLKSFVNERVEGQDENGIFYEIYKKTRNMSKEVLIIYDCNIISSKENISIDEEFSKNVSSIIEKKQKQKTLFDDETKNKILLHTKNLKK